jgi:hypothetical protein
VARIKQIWQWRMNDFTTYEAVIDESGQIIEGYGPLVGNPFAPAVGMAQFQMSPSDRASWLEKYRDAFRVISEEVQV